jgi:hypothetical protein
MLVLKKTTTNDLFFMNIKNGSYIFLGTGCTSPPMAENTTITNYDGNVVAIGQVVNYECLDSSLVFAGDSSKTSEVAICKEGNNWDGPNDYCTPGKMNK